MAKDKPTQVEVPPPLFLVVEVRRQTVHDIKMPEGCSVHVYDYNRKWGEAVLEADDNGVMCKQTIHSRPGKLRDCPYKFRLFLHTGVVKRLVLPHAGCEVVVKTYEKEDDTCKEQRWVRKS
jgi:hypothetical protein